MSFFDLTHKDKNSHARAGVIHTDHGDIQTPMFMPVGTQASVKTLDSLDLENIGAEIILGNTYHLHLRPGEDLIAEQGGLHKFMNWNKPILTDSGGFQVFSLGMQRDVRNTKATKNTKTTANNLTMEQLSNETTKPLLDEKDSSQARLVSIDEDGVTFKSYIDGSTHRFTPEEAINIQHKLGADIIMAFDECTPDDAPVDYVKAAMERTHRWAERSLAEHRRLTSVTPPPPDSLCSSERAGYPPLKSGGGDAFPSFQGGDQGAVTRYRQFLFGIIQGANNVELRKESARFISNLDFDGIAIGGESIGYNMEATAKILDWVYPIIPASKPHYAMGIGLSPTDLLTAVEHGVDMFDCVGPTRLARHGMVFVGLSDLSPTLSLKGERGDEPPLFKEGAGGGQKFRLNLTKSTFKKDLSPIDKNCACDTCQNYSRSYLHHLFTAGEISGMRLATIHNLYFMINLMKETRAAILEDRFAEFKKQWQ